MKKRNGFVSNSSSTCFTFLFKSEEYEEIVKSLYRNKKEFSVIRCDPDEVVKSIVKHIDNKGLSDVSEKLEEVNETIESLKKNIVDHNISFMRDLYYDFINRNSYLKHCYENGFNNYIDIYYGDNEGDEAGTDVAICMDMNSFHINIENNDFVVVKESNR